MGSAAVRVTGQPDKTTAAAGPGGEADVRDATRSGVRVDPGGEEHEGHDDVRSVTSGLAGVEIDRSGPRGFGMAAARPYVELHIRPKNDPTQLGVDC